MQDQEETIWEGSPSQLKNFGVYVLCVLLCVLIVPIFIAIWKWLEVKCFKYRLTTQRLSVTRGIFNKRTDELELYRIKDITLAEPFFLRLFGLGNIKLDTSDKSSPEVNMEYIAKAPNVRDLIRRHVEAMRDKKRVREIDLE